MTQITLASNVKDVQLNNPQNGETLVYSGEVFVNQSLPGGGDMLKSTYDPDNNGIVDEAESVPWSGITGVPATFPPSAHNHDDRYYTETELQTSGQSSVHWDNITNKVLSSGGHTIQDEGISLAQRTKLNFVGANVTVTDDAGNDATKVTITFSGVTASGGGHTIQDEGVDLPQRTKLNFVGAGVTVTDNAGGDQTIVTISGGSSTISGVQGHEILWFPTFTESGMPQRPKLAFVGNSVTLIDSAESNETRVYLNDNYIRDYGIAYFAGDSNDIGKGLFWSPVDTDSFLFRKPFSDALAIPRWYMQGNNGYLNGNLVDKLLADVTTDFGTERTFYLVSPTVSVAIGTFMMPTSPNTLDGYSSVYAPISGWKGNIDLAIVSTGAGVPTSGATQVNVVVGMVDNWSTFNPSINPYTTLGTCSLILDTEETYAYRSHELTFSGVAGNIVVPENYRLFTYIKAYNIAGANGECSISFTPTDSFGGTIVNNNYIDLAIAGSATTVATGGHTIQDEGVDKPARTKLNFVGAGVTVTDDAANDATKVTIDSVVGSGTGYNIQHTYKTYTVVSGTSHFDTDSTFISGTLRVYLNGLRQGSVVEDPDYGGFSLTEAALTGEELKCDYDYVSSGYANYTAITLIQDDAVTQTIQPKLNFVGNPFLVSNNEANQSTDVSISGWYAEINSDITTLNSEVTAFDSINNTGWIPESSNGTRVSNTSFTLPGDKTGIYTTGVKIKLSDSTTKYYYVISSAYSAPNTTVTVTGGSDYLVVGSSLTNIYYSREEAPVDFPNKFNFTVTYAGFSANPSGGTNTFYIVGRRCFVDYYPGSFGTSNATNYTVSLPVTARGNVQGLSRCWDNGTNQTGPGLADITTNATTISLYRDITGATWTASGSKMARISVNYPI